jgi:hypothetical protein
MADLNINQEADKIKSEIETTKDLEIKKAKEEIEQLKSSISTKEEEMLSNTKSYAVKHWASIIFGVLFFISLGLNFIFYSKSVLHNDTIEKHKKEIQKLKDNVSLIQTQVDSIDKVKTYNDKAIDSLMNIINKKPAEQIKINKKHNDDIQKTTILDANGSLSKFSNWAGK